MGMIVARYLLAKTLVMQHKNNAFHSRRFNQAFLFKAYFHRVLLREISPRVSRQIFFRCDSKQISVFYGTNT
jgi:hypothetical protein